MAYLVEDGKVIGFACMSVSERCWNWYDSYGEICVHCGCCAKDTKTRQKARLELMERRLAENEAFDRWDDNEEMRKLQEKNVALDRAYFKRKIRYYRNKLKEGEIK